MSIIIEDILKDIYEIDPGLAEKEEELKKIIKTLLSSKPEVSMDERFKSELREKILKKLSKKQPSILSWIFGNKLKIGIAAAAGVFSAVMIFGVLFPVVMSLQKSESSSITYTKDENDASQISGLDREERKEGGEEDASPQQPMDRMESETGEDGFTDDDAAGRRDELVVVSEKKSDEKGEGESRSIETEPEEGRAKAKESEATEEYELLDEIALSEDVSGMDYEELGFVAEEEYDEPVVAADKSKQPTTGEADGGEGRDWNTEEYDRIYENRFLKVTDNAVSTFSIDVDTASYSNVRRFLKNNQLPYKDSVRIEELINYFTYDYPEPVGEHPFAFFTETSECPWNSDNKLIHIGIQGKIIPAEQLPPNNLVFLLDVSGSMNDSNKLPLLKSAFSLLVKELRKEDRVAIVVYAGAAGLVLPSTPGNEKSRILDSLEQLSAGGSTAGGAGIKLAYETASQYYMDGGNNRVILATDGDFNIGPSSNAELTRLIEEKRDQGIFLTVLGFGMGNYKDTKMEKLADNGNGNYAYIDTFQEAKKVLVTELGATLLAIAKDVKIQIEFNPVYVDSYRLIGYENRVLTKEDFSDDTKDAGELGAGHTVTALYEIIPAGMDATEAVKEDLKYQETSITEEAYGSSEMMTLKLRYKKPDQETSILIETPVLDNHIPLSASSDNFRFSAAVAAWGLLLRDSAYKGDATYDLVLDLALGAKGIDEYGYRDEFIGLVGISKKLAGVK